MFPHGLLCRTTLACAVFVLLSFSAACSDKRPITQQEVSALLEEMDKAAQSENVEAIASCLSSSFHTKVTMDGYGPTATMSLDRDQYLAQTRQGFAATTGYDYRRGRTIINIAPDGQTAYVADEVYETVNVGGNVLRTVSTSSSILKREGGKLVLTNTEGVAHVSSNPSSPERTSFD